MHSLHSIIWTCLHLHSLHKVIGFIYIRLYKYIYIFIFKLENNKIKTENKVAVEDVLWTLFHYICSTWVLEKTLVFRMKVL